MASWRLCSKVLSLNKSVDWIKVLSRTFNSSYHHYSIPPAPPAYWPEHYYPDPIHYQHNPSFVSFQSMFHAHNHHQCVRPEGYFNEYYWVNGDPIWNQKTLVAYMQPHMGGFHPIFSSGEWNFSPHFYPYRQDISYFFHGGGEQPVYPNLICGQYPQTCYNGHLNNYGTQWNQQLQDVYGYDQYYRPKWTTDYNYNTAARFQGHEFSNKYYPENSTASQLKSAMSDVRDRYADPNFEEYLLRNESRHLTPAYEGYQRNSDEIRWRNVDDQPHISTHDSPNTSFSNNDNGFHKHLTEAGYNLNGSPVAGGQHYPHNTNSRRGGSRGRPEVKKNNTVNFDCKKNWDEDKWRDDNDQPQNVTVKEQPARVTFMRGRLHQSPETYQPATNETARDSRRPLGIYNQYTNSKEKHHPRDTSNRCTQKSYGKRHSAEHQNPDSGFPSPNLNAARSDEVHQVLNCENPVENIKPEKIIGTAKELQSFTKDGKLKLAVEVLDVMEKKNEHLDPELHMSTVKMLIRACGDSKAITEAKAVHKHLLTLMSPLKFSLFNKILGMYLKCGAVADAYSMFYSMSAHNLTSWDTMIKGLVRNNLGEEALDLFAEFKRTGLEPDGLMFLGVFAACRHVGDVIEAMLHFESMTKRYGITPSMKHYISIVDMMGHVGHLEEAMDFIEKMPVEPSVDVWETMMNVCRIQGNLELVDRCAEVVQELDPTRFSEEMKVSLFHR